MVRRLRRWRAQLRLDRVDAEVARWYVEDGQLSPLPLHGSINYGLANRRMRAVRALVAAGGRDPHPSFMRLPTDAQRRGAATRNRQQMHDFDHAQLGREL